MPLEYISFVKKVQKLKGCNWERNEAKNEGGGVVGVFKEPMHPLATNIKCHQGYGAPF